MAEAEEAVGLPRSAAAAQCRVTVQEPAPSNGFLTVALLLLSIEASIGCMQTDQVHTLRH